MILASALWVICERWFRIHLDEALFHLQSDVHRSQSQFLYRRRHTADDGRYRRRHDCRQRLRKLLKMTSGTRWLTSRRRPTFLPAPTVKRRRVWPWVVGIGGAFILGIVAISMAAAILAPRMIRPDCAERDRRTRNDKPEQRIRTSPVTADSNSKANNRLNDVETPPPTDHEQVLAQLQISRTSGQLRTSTPTRRSSIEFSLTIMSVQRNDRRPSKQSRLHSHYSNVIPTSRSGNSVI